MAARRSSRWVPSPSARAWLVLALPVILPLLLILLKGGTSEPADNRCELHLPFGTIIELSCRALRIVSFIESAAGAFLVVVLIWWLFSELIGLRRIFEVPWFGVGEDVENVGVIESIVRAGLFVGAVWLTIGLCALAYMGMTGGMVATKPTPQPTPGPAVVEIAPIIAAADRLTGEVKGIRDKLTGQPQSVSIDPALVPQLQRLGESLREIQSILTRQDGKLDALRQIDGRMAQWEQQRSGPAILEEARRLNGALGEVRTSLDGVGRQLAALGNIEGLVRDLDIKQVPAIAGEVGNVSRTLGEVRTQLDGQGRKLAVLDDIERVLRDLDVKQVPAVAGEVSNVGGAVVEVQRRLIAQTNVLERIEPFLKQPRLVDVPQPPSTPRPTPTPTRTSCFDRSDGASRSTSAAAGPRQYERTVSVFFDKAASEPTRGAFDKLAELSDELNHIDQPAVLIFGSADAQGVADRNTGLARQRASAVEQFLKMRVPQLVVRIASAPSTDDPASEPYNRIARVEAHGICR
ncbi:hypothetical protein JQ633_00070 [Bradyrhizobium tropiciagri]|uniref:hypothetical protein n=1 Tax=Bradyrhizobium tropiciagri TaxID=312253 RepID=UPI001BAB1520|nr:hypothetical protein [Bradyrhizobium tropiciagri]MBR0868733.1 hypothetical protein [Bradyrhizobium tropiciagri]